MAILRSSWAAMPIPFTDLLEADSWAGARENQLAIPGGFMWLKNDSIYAYIALDLTRDTNNDPGTGDFFWLTFDRNRNNVITPSVDVNYGAYPGQPNKLGRQFYLGPNIWTGLSVGDSSCQIAFGTSPNSDTAHRIWKLKIKLTEISVSLSPFIFWTPFAKFGLKIASSNPPFNKSTPSNFSSNFLGLHTMYFARKARIPSAVLGPVMGSVGLIPSTKISTSTGKATTDPGYYVSAQNDAFGGLLNIIGNRTQMQALWAAGARKYKVLSASGSSASYANQREGWRNYVWNGSDYILESFGPDASDFYPLLNPTVDYSIDDLLYQFDSTRLPTGLIHFKVQFFTTAGAAVPTPAQTLTMYIDNNLPAVHINNIRHGKSLVNACDIVQMNNPTDGVTVNYDAFDAEGNLHSYSLSANWGDNAGTTIESATYNIISGPSWTGVTNKTSILFVPVITCAHSFTVTAWARTTNGYGRIGYNSASRFVTLMK
jgi:hypothetical protein